MSRNGPTTEASAGTDDGARRTATVETSHTDAATAETVAAAVRPDNTADVETVADGATVRTRITRETTGGLQSSVDDYVVNLSVADAVIEAVDAGADDPEVETTERDSTRADTDSTHADADSTDTTTDDSPPSDGGRQTHDKNTTHE
jgi:hypothetical protein